MRKIITPVYKVLLWGGAILLLIVALAFLLDSMAQSQQSKNPSYPKIQMEGQYRIGDGPWQPIVPGEHIPSNKGDVTLHGTLRMLAPDTGEDLGPVSAGVPVALYCDHIFIRILQPDGSFYSCDAENPIFGDDACGILWSAYYCEDQEPVTLLVHNPHRFGNIGAVDALLSSMSVYADTLFEEAVRSEGDALRSLGILFLVSASILLGISLFTLLVHINNSMELFLMGLVILFAGLYFLFDAPGVFFWNSSLVMNTTVLGLSMMFYMLAVDALVVGLLEDRAGKAGLLFTVILGATDLLLIALPLFTKICFYDLWLIWFLLQALVNLLLLVCLLAGHRAFQKGHPLALLIGGFLVFAGFWLDGLATALGWWQGGIASKYIFIAIFIAFVFLTLRVLPHSINAGEKAKALETEQKVLQAELQHSRVATMMSQIQPHFIYNTLSSIEQLCTDQPRVAAELVHNFSEYLQGNFRQVDDLSPILFSREIAHVRHYTDIEQIRFGDMTILYDIRVEDFLIPALTVQPLVENAIKHGLMGLEEGGCVTIRAEETASHFCVSVIDDGIGFDTTALEASQQKVGIRNIRGRLRAICNGVLEIESAPGAGTTARILIPKQ